VFDRFGSLKDIFSIIQNGKKVVTNFMAAHTVAYEIRGAVVAIRREDWRRF